MKILIIEDEYSLADAIAEALKKEKFTTNIITNGEEGEDEALTNIYDLILLDVMLPGKDGFEILRSLRNEKIETPVIMLTAKSEICDKLNGLENGADDYITKPFHMQELIARAKVILKRNSNIKNTNILEYSDLKLDLRTGKMSSNNIEIPINGKELDLLEILLLNKKQIVEREILANKIWGYNSEAEYNNVEVYVSFLRKKLKLLKSHVKIKDKKKSALELMKSVGLKEEQAKRKILKLSGGEQQRIAIARSLSYNPKIIIADEPTGNLDKDTENEILKIFNTLAKEENKCIIIVTHSQNVCDKVDTVYELANGK